MGAIFLYQETPGREPEGSSLGMNQARSEAEAGCGRLDSQSISGKHRATATKGNPGL